jgi:hypothetical protein
LEFVRKKPGKSNVLLNHEGGIMKKIEIYCGICGAVTSYDTDMEIIMDEWNITGVDDPCSPDCHVPEDDLAELSIKSKINGLFEHLFPEEVKESHFQRLLAGNNINPNFVRGIGQISHVSGDDAASGMFRNEVS